MFARSFILLASLSIVIVTSSSQDVLAQAIGVELHNSLMPAAGAMGGASGARPQDLQSTLGGNPATLTQFLGTNIGFGGAWVEPTIKIDNRADLRLAGIRPYQERSNRPGSVLGNIVAARDLHDFNLPVTIGGGLLTASGLGVDFRENLASNGTSAELVALAFGGGAGVQVNENLSVGAALFLGTATLDGPFTGVTAATPDYALRAHLGATYNMGYATTVAFYWMTRQDYKFSDTARIGGRNAPFRDVLMDLPSTFGWGVANESLMDGRLLLAGDILYKQWSEADFFGSIWEDQFVLMLGAQYTTQRGLKLRIGYTFAENVTAEITTRSIGGISPQEGIDYIQSLFPNINEHRFTLGVGVPNILPNVDLDVFAGGAPEESQASGNGLTTISLESYWIGTGLTWHFGGCNDGGCTQ